jgi:hypothetical protein
VLSIATYYFQGKYAQIEQSIEKALGLVERTPGSQTLQILDHSDLAHILKTYASLLSALNRKSEAAEILERVKAIRTKHAKK